MGAMRAAKKIGGEAVSTVRDALLAAAALPHDVVQRALEGSEKE
jgi:hypothetical protein